jgi:hypothetical protein
LRLTRRRQRPESVIIQDGIEMTDFRPGQNRDTPPQTPPPPPSHPNRPPPPPPPKRPNRPPPAPPISQGARPKTTTTQTTPLIGTIGGTIGGTSTQS